MDKYLVIGNPIEHSKSPFIHQRFAEQTNQSIQYTKQLVALDDFESFVYRFMEQGGRGCNITVPFKERAFAMAHHVTERAQAAGAVNTLSFSDNGEIIADNTDGQGLVEDLQTQQIPIFEQRILIIGAGGAARGCILPLLAENPQSITITNRTFAKAQQLVSELKQSQLHCAEMATLTAEYDIIINSTSASLSKQLPDIADHVIAQSHCCYDMVYANEPTCFLQWAQGLGVETTVDGLGMLVGQAAESFSIWRATKPSIMPVLQAIREQL